jgi:NitT/TauT family transport system substrate-binding protein
MKSMNRRTLLASGAAAGVMAGLPRAQAADGKLSILTSWFAQAEHGGFYQAVATGIYKKAGLDVDVRMGGPQVNGMQLLAGGDADMALGYDIQMITSVEKGLPLITIGTTFQADPQCIMTHKNITSLEQLKGHKILVSSAAYTTYWPWLKQKYGYTDDMTGVYTYNLQPFVHDESLSVQSYVTSEPFEVQKMGVTPNVFVLGDYGYPPYGQIICSTTGLVNKSPDVVAAFMKASMEGWVSYMNDPKPGNKLIQEANPKMEDAQIAYSIGVIKKLNFLDRGEAKTKGIGTMTEARWKSTYDFLLKGGLVKPTTDYKKAFTLKFVDNMHVMMT